MNPRVIAVRTMPDYLLEVEFSDRDKKVFNVKPYLDHGLFSELKDVKVFATATASLGTVVWANGLDICPDTLYLEGK